MEKASTGFERILVIIGLSDNLQKPQLRRGSRQRFEKGYIA